MTVAFSLFTAAVLSQATAAEAPPQTPDERAALAAEKAALAAEKAAAAAERIANSVAPAPAPDEKKEPDAAEKKDAWAGSAGLGLTYITGNAQNLTLTANVAADRKWVVWSMGIRLWGSYGIANPQAGLSGSGSQTTARRAGGTLRGERAFGSGFASVFALAGSELDHVKNIESRSIGEGGVGLTFFSQKEGDLEKLFLRLDLALRAGYETRFQYFPTPAAVDPYAVVILAPRGALAFRWAFNKHVRVSEEIELIPFLLAPDAGRLLINNTTKLSSRITENLALTAAVVVAFDSKPPQAAPPPAPQRVPTDVTLTAGLEAVF